MLITFKATAITWVCKFHSIGDVLLSKIINFNPFISTGFKFEFIQ